MDGMTERACAWQLIDPKLTTTRYNIVATVCYELMPIISGNRREQYFLTPSTLAWCSAYVKSYDEKWWSVCRPYVPLIITSCTLVSNTLMIVWCMYVCMYVCCMSCMYVCMYVRHYIQHRRNYIWLCMSLSQRQIANGRCRISRLMYGCTCTSMYIK